MHNQHPHKSEESHHKHLIMFMDTADYYYPYWGLFKDLFGNLQLKNC